MSSKWIGLTLCVGLWLASTGTAEARDHAQPSFLAQMVADLVTDQLLVESDLLIRLPMPDRWDLRPLVEAQEEADVVDLFAGGMQVGSEAERRSIVLQLKPNLGRRGGLLRCTFRF